MIASLNGVVLAKPENALIVGLGGLGLRVFVPTALRDRVEIGEQVFMHTYLVVREEALVLYGFETMDAHDFFSLLLGVDGVGPRTALATLSVLSTDAIRRAVISEQADVFGRVPGVGKKTAQKILLHLQGRIGPPEGPLGAVAAMTDVDTEVLSALTALGYSIVEAQTALQAIPRSVPADVETRLRLALQYFSS